MAIRWRLLLWFPRNYQFSGWRLPFKYLYIFKYIQISLKLELNSCCRGSRINKSMAQSRETCRDLQCELQGVKLRKWRENGTCPYSYGFPRRKHDHEQIFHSPWAKVKKIARGEILKISKSDQCIHFGQFYDATTPWLALTQPMVLKNHKESTNHNWRPECFACSRCCVHLNSSVEQLVPHPVNNTKNLLPSQLSWKQSPASITWRTRVGRVQKAWDVSCIAQFPLGLHMPLARFRVKICKGFRPGFVLAQHLKNIIFGLALRSMQELVV